VVIQKRNDGAGSGVLNKLHIGGRTVFQGYVLSNQLKYFAPVDGGAAVDFGSHIELPSNILADSQVNGNSIKIEFRNSKYETNPKSEYANKQNKSTV
jgi:hypothetical protein